jgi:hypothetical protein
MAMLKPTVYRFPEAAEGIQVDDCKKVRCTASGTGRNLVNILITQSSF